MMDQSPITRSQRSRLMRQAPVTSKPKRKSQSVDYGHMKYMESIRHRQDNDNDGVEDDGVEDDGVEDDSVEDDSVEDDGRLESFDPNVVTSSDGWDPWRGYLPGDSDDDSDSSGDDVFDDDVDRLDILEDDLRLSPRYSDPWVLHPTELKEKLEFVQNSEIYDDMPDAAREKYSFDNENNYSIESGDDGNRHPEIEDDHNIANEANMASVTIGVTTRSKQSHVGLESTPKHVLSAQERLSPRVYLQDEITRDHLRMSYRLSKGNLHPHFEDSTNGQKRARKPRSPLSSTASNEEFRPDERIEKKRISGRLRRRKSMVLALEEGEVVVSGGSGSSTPAELRLRASTGETIPLSALSNPSSPPRTPDNVLDKSCESLLSSDGLGSTEQLRYGTLPSNKEKHLRHSFSAESKTVKTPPLPRRALSETKDNKVKPKDFMAKLRNSFLRKSKKEKKTPVISSPIARVDSGSIEPLQMEEQVQLRDKKASNSRDPSARLTWHGTTDSDGRGARSRRTSPGGDKYLSTADVSSDLESSKSTMNVAEFGRQLSRPRLSDFYEQDSDGNSSSAIGSPTSSICSSNPSSRPVSATDLPWERYHMSGIRRAESEGYLKPLSNRQMNEFKRHSSGGLIAPIGSPPRYIDRSPFGSGTLLEHPKDRELNSHRSEELLSPSGRKMERVIFEEAEHRRLQEITKTPKPRHQPRRVKTDLGDHRGIISALQYDGRNGDVERMTEDTPVSSRNTTPSVVRRRNLRRRAISDIGTRSNVLHAIEQTNTKENDRPHRLSVTITDIDGQTQEVENVSQSVDHSTSEDSRVNQTQEQSKEIKSHRRSASQGTVTRSTTESQDGELKRSDSTETLTQRTPSQPSLVSMDSMEITKDDRNSSAQENTDDNNDNAPYIPVNVDLQEYGLGPIAIFAEALWDHVTMDETELAFQAGDVIEVTDTTDKNWWWGYLGESEGWIPTQFIRLRVSQGETVEECMERLRQEEKDISLATHGRIGLNFLSNDQVRANVVHEILTTERDYVRNLRDVCKGYLDQARQRPEMFSEESVQNIFGNIEEVYEFEQNFAQVLEGCFHHDFPDLSEIGNVFLDHESGFDIYSDYCNNYPRAIGELTLLMEKPKYRHFFEACRLLRNMIEISLHGFLLTPVQKICKYPLQLAELLKYTRTEHPDHRPLTEALRVMRNVAFRINERKRTIENIEKIASWQKTILDWEGDDILERSYELIYSGEITKILVKNGRKRTVERMIYLFDHQLIICKKDMLRRGCQYRRRLNMDRCHVTDLPDGRDNSGNFNIKNGWRIWDSETYKMYMFSAKSVSDKVKWLQAFEDERQIVEEEKTRGVHIPTWTKEAAMKHASLIDRPNKPSDLTGVGRRKNSIGMPFEYQHKIMEEEQTKVELPQGISSSDVFKGRKRKGILRFSKRSSDEGNKDYSEV